MLKVTGLEKTFDIGTINEKKALCGIDLTLQEGDFVTVIGGNGAGKSTLLNAIAGVFPVDRGHIYLNGQEVTKLPEHKRAKLLGRVFQDPMMGTAADMGLEENLALAYTRGQHRTLTGGSSPMERALFREQLLQLELGLEYRMNAKAGLLSGGQRQALTLLMATLKKPSLLLLDEHTAALDPKTAAKVLEISDRIIEEHKLTAMMVTHNMRDAIRHGNRLIMMDSGRIILDIQGEEKKRLTVEELLERFHQVSGANISNDRMLLSK